LTPSLPQGTRDFGPDIVRRRKFIFDTVVNVFELYGFEPLETPAMENLETLMGKYGDEGDKLIFKILNNGLDNPSKREPVIEAFEHVLQGRSNKQITERALRYDLTIPFARYVAMNYNKLTLPYKRYQVQPVWRADRPQKGRYREFYQCDADIAGSYSILHDTELALIYLEVFNRLNIPVQVKVNSRKILQSLADSAGDASRLVQITTAIDKLDKIGLDKTLEELRQQQLGEQQIELIRKYLMISGTNSHKLSLVEELLQSTPILHTGIEEVRQVVTNAVQYENSGKIIFDPSLARGLNYYTGIIYEVIVPSVKIGSIGGGGRYDDLTGLFGVPQLPGVGISFGIDRIYDVMEELNLFPEHSSSTRKVMFFNLGKAESQIAFEKMQELRASGIVCELYHEQAKLDKQFKYAERKNASYVVIIGSRELENKTCVIKNLMSGVQETKSFEEIRSYFATIGAAD
jgi:histidyl-tRNA synthetase